MSDNTKYINLSELGVDLKEARHKRGLSQFEVAKRCDISYSMYQRWEGGVTKQVKADNFYRLKEVLTGESETE